MSDPTMFSRCVVGERKLSTGDMQLDQSARARASASKCMNTTRWGATGGTCSTLTPGDPMTTVDRPRVQNAECIRQPRKPAGQNVERGTRQRGAIGRPNGALLLRPRLELAMLRLGRGQS
jgi:hypothetical protein